MDLWAMDEVHFQRFGSRCRMWVPPEERDPILLHHPGRQSVGYFGAVRIRDGRFVYRREDASFNGQTFWDFLKQFRRASIRTGRKTVVISDNARYHHARLHLDWRETHVESFELLFLPPYSPEFNPIERVWKLVRRLRLHNQYFGDVTDIVEAVEDLFADWGRGNNTLRRLCAFT